MLWEVPDKASKTVSQICEGMDGRKNLILATDPDREGEAISWHLAEELQVSK